MTAQLSDIIINKPKISKAGSGISAAALKKVQDTILYYLQEEIKYVTPTDRHIEIDTEGLVTSKTVTLVVAITPRWRNLEEKKSSALKRSLIITLAITLDELELRLTKPIQWALNYFGLQIMYRQDVKQITIRASNNSYKIEEST